MVRILRGVRIGGGTGASLRARLASRSGPSGPRFLIFGQGRTGSTLLTELLNSHSRIRCEGEILNPPQPKTRSYVTSHESRAAGEAYGFKLLYYQLRAVAEDGGPQGFLEWLDGRGYRIFHLVRENRLRHVLSNMSARHQGFHHRAGDRTASGTEVDVTHLVDWLRLSDEAIGYGRECLGDLPRVDLVYERDLSTPDVQRRTVDRICDELGLPHEPLSTDLVPATPRDLRDLVANYDEMAAALAGTPYERFLSEPDAQS
jgi:LPS sulfotransferase NodH